MTSHLEEKLQHDRDRIRDKVREMADLALRALEESVRALTTGDRRLAYASILRDSRIDELESLIDALCVEFIVRHIPVAAHLRFVHSVAKIVAEIERVGDYAESINRQSVLLAPDRPEIDYTTYEQLAGVSIEMVRQAVRSFLDEDVELSRATIDLDARANRLHQEIYQQLQKETPADADDLERLFSLLSVANRYERVADQAVNICNEVFYIVTGEVVKHRPATDQRVVFLSSGDSCRHLMAEGIARTIGGGRLEFSSIATDAAAPSPSAQALLVRKSIPAPEGQVPLLADIGDLTTYKCVVTIGEAPKLPRVGFRTIVLEWDDVIDPETSVDPEIAYGEVFDDLVGRVGGLIRSLHGTVSVLETEED